MERKKSFLIKATVILAHLVLLGGLIELYNSGRIIFEAFLALIFLQAFVAGLMLSLYFIYKKFSNLAKLLGFHYISGSFPHPKFEGIYKDNWWQIHFVSRDYGAQWGQPRTYVKLQWKEKKDFEDNLLAKHNSTVYNNQKIVSVSHIVRDSKNYLLLKREWFTFDKRKINQLMDYLLKIAAEAEVKHR